MPAKSTPGIGERRKKGILDGSIRKRCTSAGFRAAVWIWITTFEPVGRSLGVGMAVWRERAREGESELLATQARIVGGMGFEDIFARCLDANCEMQWNLLQILCLDHAQAAELMEGGVME